MAGCRGRHYAQGAGLGLGDDAARERCLGAAGGLAVAVVGDAGRFAGQGRCCARSSGHAAAGSDEWCGAHTWLGRAALFGPIRPGRSAISPRSATPWDRPAFPALAGAWAAGHRYCAEWDGRRAAGDGRRFAGAGPGGDPWSGRRWPWRGSAWSPFRRRPRRCGTAGPAGGQAWAGIPGTGPGCAAPLTIVLTQVGDLAAAGRRAPPGWPGPGTRATCGIWGSCWRGWSPWTCAGPVRGRRGAPTGRAPPRGAHRRTLIAARGPGLLRLPVRRDRSRRRGPHATGGGGRARAQGALGPGASDLPEGRFQRQEPLREARQALGPAQARAAEERGKAMSLATAAEYALMLTAPGPRPPAAAPGPETSAPGNGNWSPWSPGGKTRRSPGSCLSVHGQLAPGPHPRQAGAGAAPTSLAWPSVPAWCNGGVV